MRRNSGRQCMGNEASVVARPPRSARADRVSPAVLMLPMACADTTWRVSRYIVAHGAARRITSRRLSRVSYSTTKIRGQCDEQQCTDASAHADRRPQRLRARPRPHIIVTETAGHAIGQPITERRGVSASAHPGAPVDVDSLAHGIGSPSEIAAPATPRTSAAELKAEQQPRTPATHTQLS